MKQWLRIGEMAAELGVCTKTLRRWEALGKLTCIRTLGKHRRIAMSEIHRIRTGQRPETPTSQTAIYTRVSSQDQRQKGDLQRQTEALTAFCRQQKINDPLIMQDVSSGLNTKRRGLTTLCNLVEQGKIAREC